MTSVFDRDLRVDFLGEGGDEAEIGLRVRHALAFEQHHRIVCIGSDRSHRLIDLMRHAGCDLPERCKLIGLRQAVLRSQQFGLGAAAFFHFAHQLLVGVS
jgi:hypothetical protein